MSDETRTETMATKLAAYARRAGVPSDRLLHAYELALEQRVSHLRNVFHPDLLHPARTALILLEDAHVRDADVLTAGALTETEFDELRVADAVIRDAFSERVAGLVMEVPQPAQAADRLLECLLEVSAGAALVAVAERLDHARHLHFRDPSLWPSFYAEVTSVYLPFAERVSQPLAHRFSRWSHAFRRRFPLSA